MCDTVLGCQMYFPPERDHDWEIEILSIFKLKSLAKFVKTKPFLGRGGETSKAC